jgi:hypothetical protein
VLVYILDTDIYAGYVITPVSLRLWKSKGRISFHSIALVICGLVITLRWAAKASHKIAINRRVATNEIIAPIEDRAFHGVIASG